MSEGLQLSNKREKKRVLFVIESLGCGGAERSFISLLNVLDVSKYKIDIFILKRGGMFEKFLPKGINLISPTCFLKNMSIIAILKRLSIRQLIAKIKFSFLIRVKKGKVHGAELLWGTTHKLVERNETNYDVAIAYHQGFPTYYVSDKITANKKISWINVDIDKAGYSPDFNKDYYNRFDSIVAVSDSLKQLLEKNYYQYIERISSVYDILNPELIRKMSEDVGFEDDFIGLRIVTIGRMVVQKGYDIAVKAAKILKEQGYTFRWYAVGGGDQMEVIGELINKYGIEDCFVLMGMKENPFPYLKQCDIYAQTSKFEGFGLTLSEAKILHKPIVSTNFPSAYDQICNGINGIIVDMTGEDIARGISDLIENHELRVSLIESVKKENNNTSVTELSKVMNLIDL